MGNSQRRPATMQDLTNACVRPRIPFLNASPPEKLWNHDPNDVNQVYSDIFISGGEFAKNLDGIRRKRITHVLNTAEGRSFMHVDTGPDFYPEDIKYKGFRANDTTSYDLSVHFDECSDFIEDALTNEGRVLVHCRQGYSRSPTIVAAYLMQKKGMSAKKALETMRSRREIFPNEGFMNSLIELEKTLFFQDKQEADCAPAAASSSGDAPAPDGAAKAETEAAPSNSQLNHHLDKFNQSEAFSLKQTDSAADRPDAAAAATDSEKDVRSEL